MRMILLAAAACVALAFAHTAARADGAWCARDALGCTNCGFHTHAQCMANVSGMGGILRTQSQPCGILGGPRAQAAQQLAAAADLLAYFAQRAPAAAAITRPQSPPDRMVQRYRKDIPMKAIVVAALIAGFSTVPGVETLHRPVRPDLQAVPGEQPGRNQVEARADRDRRRLRLRLRLPHGRDRRLVQGPGDRGGHRRADAALRGPDRARGEYPHIESLFGLTDKRGYLGADRRDDDRHAPLRDRARPVARRHRGEARPRRR